MTMNTTVIQRNLLYVSCLNDLQQTVFQLFDSNKYKYIYVSIGSKWNQDHYEYSEMYGNMKTRATNSHLQLVPNFMRHRNEKSLLIAFDQFHNVENRMENFKIVQNRLDKNMDFIFYDNIDILEPFLQFILEIIEINKILPDDFMFVNYIRFQRPNQLEYSTEKNSKQLVKDILKNSIYRNCHYVWFGYQENLYNIIYNYNNYELMYNFNQILCTLHTLLRSSLFGKDNIFYVYNYYKTQKNYLYFTIFLKNSVDISSCCDSENKICECLHDFE